MSPLIRCYVDEPFGLSWTPLPPQIPWRSHGFLPRVDGVELELVDEVMGVVLGPDLLRPRSGEDVHVESSIQFPSSAR